MISYFDIRHSKNAMRNLQGKLLRRRKLDIHYSIPKDNPSEKDQNQGTLVVFNLGSYPPPFPFPLPLPLFLTLPPPSNRLHHHE